jgi:antitoxin component of MazEF toxin-antitoxin module
MSVKIRKVGNSSTLTVPSHISPKAEEYEVFQGRDGVIVYVPKKSNPFYDEKFIASNDFTQDEVFGGPLVGEEIPKE